jgi:nucleoside-diphosphate kinase
VPQKSFYRKKEGFPLLIMKTWSDIMVAERTLSIVKPDAMKKNVLGKILTIFEDNGLKVVAGRVMNLTKSQAQQFYAVHKERPFFEELVTFMCSGPVFVSALEGEEAVAKNRELMGATNPADAAEGTIRKHFASSIGENAVHGSDSLENAEIEVRFFFPELDG